jgi:predicted nucleic-acid-binding protein
MKGVGLDTSVVVRLLTKSPLDQAETALKRILALKSDRYRVLVSDFVVLEAFHVLRHIYKVPVKKVVAVLLDFLESNLVEPDQDASSVKVLKECLSGNMDFMDQLIRMDYAKSTDKILTFDKKFSKLKGVEIIAT